MKIARPFPLSLLETAAWMLLIGIALWTLPDYGVSWDEQIRFDQGEKKWDYYRALLRGEDAQPPKDHYPGLHDLLHVGVVRLFSVDWILAGHALNLAFGLAGAWAVRSTAVAIVGRAGGPVALVVLILGFPRLYGHFFINPKDVPFFAGYAWSLYFLVKMALRKNVSWRHAIGWGIATGATLGVRIGGFLLWGYAGLLWLELVGCWIATRRDPGEGVGITPHAVTGAMRLAAGSVISIFILFIVWPALHADAIEQAGATASTVQDFDWDLPVLFGGRYFKGPDLPAFYLPWMFIITTPIPIIVLLAAGAGWGFFRVSRKPALLGTGRGLAVETLAFAAMFPIIYVVATDATVYNGIRHLLFVVAPLATMAAVSAVLIYRAMATRSKSRARMLAGLGVLALLPSMMALVRLHPYQYIYYNALLGGVSGVEGRYELDYWGTAYKEAMSALVAQLDAETIPPGTTFIVGTEHVPWLLRPYVPEDRNYTLDVRRSAGPDADFYIACTISEAHRFYAGEVIATVERSGAVLAVVKDRRELEGAQRAMFYGE